MKTNFLRLFAIFWWMTVCTYAMAQHDSIFVQGYINNVLDDEMCFQVMEDMGTVGFIKDDVGQYEGRPKSGNLDLIFYHNRSGIRYFELTHTGELNWNLIKVGFWAAKGDTVRIEGNGYLNGTWQITVNNPEQQEDNLYRESCLEEIKAYQLALWDYAKYRDWRRYAPEMEEKDWDKTVVHVKRLEKKIDSLRIKVS